MVVKHNTDGTKSIQIGFLKKTYSAFFFVGQHQYKIAHGTTKNVTLKRIPMTSGISVEGDFTMGEGGTIRIAKAHDTFTHTIKYRCGPYEGTVIEDTSSSLVSWTPPLELANVVPNDAKVAGTLYLDTYSGGTKVGTDSCTFRARVPASMKPSITAFTPSRVNNEVPAGWGIYLQTFSQCELAIDAVGTYGSTIQSYSIKLNDQVISSERTGTSAVLKTAGTVTFTATVTDSRQMSASKTCQITVEPYHLPSINPVESQRCLHDGTPNDDGTYIRCEGAFDLSPCGGHNSAICRVYYRRSGTESWLGGQSFQSGVAVVIDANANVDYSYECMYEITDYFKTAQVIDIVGTGFTTMDFKKGGTGVAIGKVAEEDYVFDVAIKTKLRGGFVLIDNDGVEHDLSDIIGLKDFVIEEGTSGIWKFRKWKNGTAECWGKIRKSVSGFVNWGGMKTSYNDPIPAIQFPFVFKEPPIVTATPVYDGFNDYWLSTHTPGRTTVSATPPMEVVSPVSCDSIYVCVSVYVIGQYR